MSLRNNWTLIFFVSVFSIIFFKCLNTFFLLIALFVRIIFPVLIFYYLSNFADYELDNVNPCSAGWRCL